MVGKVTIVAMGDSTTAGTPGWKSRVEAPPDGAGDETSQYAYWLMQAHPEWDVVNQGVNGERSDQILAHCEKRLGCHVGETSKDGKVTLRTAECLASCGTAPMMQVDKTYYENLTLEQVDKILDGLVKS